MDFAPRPPESVRMQRSYHRALPHLGRKPSPGLASARGADILLVSLAAALWGTIGTANGLMSDPAGVDAALCALARTGLGGLSLLIIAEILRIPWQGAHLPWRLLGTFATAGAIFQTCFFAGFVTVGVTITVAVTVCGSVALVAAGSALFNWRLPEAAASVAIAIATVGVVLTLFGESSGVGALASINGRGALILLGSALGFAVVCATARGMSQSLHPLRAAGLGLSATAGLLLLALFTRGRGLESLAPLPGIDLAILAYTGIFGTGVAYLAFVAGLHLSQSAASGVAPTLIEPGVAALLAALVLHERLAPIEAAGCVLMLGAMLPLFLRNRRSSS